MIEPRAQRTVHRGGRARGDTQSGLRRGQPADPDACGRSGGGAGHDPPTRLPQRTGELVRGPVGYVDNWLAD